MPTPYQINDGAILECTFVGKLSGQVVMSVFHYKSSNTGLGILGRTALDQMFSKLTAAHQLYSTWLAALSQSFTNGQVVLQWIDPTRFARVEYTPADTVGGIAVDALPPNDGGAITKRTDHAGRQQVGTLHVPALPKTAVTDGLLNGVALVPYQDLADSIPQEVELTAGGAIMLPVIFHRDAPAISPQIVSTVVQQESRIQRRRTVGLGK